MIKNSNGQFIQFYNGNITTIDQLQLPGAHTEDYNRCVFFMRQSNIDSFLTEYKSSAEYFLPPNNLVKYDSSSNRLRIINNSITKDYFTFSGRYHYITEISTDRTYPGVGTIDSISNTYFTIRDEIYYEDLITIDQSLVSI
jgi:hypothetical protein